MAGLSRRKKTILRALAELKGVATTRQIAGAANLNVNGASQTLGVLYPYVICLGRRGGECKWELVDKEMFI